MYVRTVTSKGIQYAQLAHNVRDPKTGQPRAQVLYTFGRVDQLDLDALRRLVRSIARFLPPDEQAQLQKDLGMEWPFRYLGSLKLGGTWLLDGLWRRLGIQKTLQRLLQQRHYQTPIERLLFAMVANRALAPSSKLAIEKWVAQEVYIDQLPAVEVHQLYRAMDFLLDAAEEIQREVFWTLANLGLQLRGEPPHPAGRRRSLHHRGEVAVGPPGGARGGAAPGRQVPQAPGRAGDQGGRGRRG